MSDNSQTTDPLAAKNQDPNEDEWGPMVAGVIAEDALPDLVRDPAIAQGDTTSKGR